MIKLKLDAAKIGGGGSKLPEGKFRVKLEKVLEKDSKRFTTPGTKVVVEFDVLKVYSKIPSVSWKGETLDANPGDRRSWTIDMAKGDIAIGNATAFTAAACGIDPGDPAALKAAKDPNGVLMSAVDSDGYNGWSKAFAQLCEPNNPGRGIELDVVVRKETTEAKRTIMIHTWSPCTAELISESVP